MASQLQAVHSLNHAAMLDGGDSDASNQTNYDPGQAHLRSGYRDRSHANEPSAAYNYKPTALRSWFLIAVAGFFLMCVAMTEYAIRSEPRAAEVYNNGTLEGRRDNDIQFGEGLRPISQDKLLSPKGMPRLERDETAFLYHRVPNPTSFLQLSPGHATRTNHASGSVWPSYAPTTLSTTETSTSDRVTTITETASSTTAPRPMPIHSFSRGPIGTVIVIPKSTSQIPEPISTSADTKSTMSTSTIVYPALVSTSTEQRRDPSGHQTAVLHTTTIQPARTSYVAMQPTTAHDSTQLDSPATSSPLLTTFTSTLLVGDMTSATITIPEILSVSTEETEDLSGLKTTILHTSTIQSLRTFTTEISLDSTQGAEEGPLTTVVTSTVGYTTPGAHTTLVEETTTLPGFMIKVPETTTDSLGHDITTLIDSTIPAQTITTQEVSILQNDDTLRTTLIKEIESIGPSISQILKTTTDSLGNVVTTLFDSTIPAHVLTTEEVSILQQDFTARTTLIKETETISASTSHITETTTNSLGHIITTVIDSTIPARTITIQEVSTYDIAAQSTYRHLGLETQQQRLLASYEASPTVKVLVSTIHYTTVIPTSIPTVAPIPPNGLNSTEFQVHGLTAAEYFSGEFLPTILAVIASLLLEVIGNNAKRMQPFFALASSTSGATARSSVFLRFDNWFGAMTIPQAIRLKQPLIFITQVAVVGSQIIAPLSAEAVQIYTPSSCTASCLGKVGVQRQVGRALEGLLVTTAVLLIITVVMTNLQSFKTGVNHNPWSAAGMASLCSHPSVRNLLARIPRGNERPVDEKSIAKVLAGQRYMLGTFWQTSQQSCGEKRYGLILGASDVENRFDPNQELLLHDKEQVLHPQQYIGSEGSIGTKVSPWLRPLTWWFRLAFLGLIATVLVIVTYYEDTSGSSGFENFMDSRGFGVRFLFTGLGVLLGGLMGAIFECVALITPYHRLSQRTLPADRSILLSTPTKALSGMVSAYFQRSPLLGLVSFTTALGKIVLPVTLDQVPFAYNSTWLTQQICAWLSIAILALMIVVVAGLSFVEWPPLPVDPSTIAGAMFYICESQIVDNFDGLAVKDEKDRDRYVRAMGSTYAYWQTVDEGGLRLGRPRVDIYNWNGE